MFSLAICDDDTDFGVSLGNLILQTSAENLTVNTYSSGLQLWHDFSNKLTAFDLLLIDIRMPLLDGIEASLRIRQNDELLPIIFITAYQDEMPRCFDAHPYHFITKPYDKAQLISVIDSAISFIKKVRPQHSLLIKTRSLSYYLPLSEILYIESMGRKLHIHTADKTHEMSGRISSIANMLCENGFALCHRCILVNLYAATRIDYSKRTIHLRGGKFVVMSADRIPEIKYAQHQLLRLKIHE